MGRRGDESIDGAKAFPHRIVTVFHDGWVLLLTLNDAVGEEAGLESFGRKEKAIDSRECEVSGAEGG